MGQIHHYLAQIRTALESESFDLFEQIIDEFESIKRALQAASQSESIDVNALANLHKEVISLIHLAEQQKQNLADTRLIIEKRKSNITAYVKNR